MDNIETRMSKSSVYKNGGTIQTQNFHEDNEKVASAARAAQQERNLRDVVGKALDAKSMQDQDNSAIQWQKDFEGYSKIVDKDDNIRQIRLDSKALEQGMPLSQSPEAEAARSYRPQPSFMDNLKIKLGNAFNWEPLPTGAENFEDPYKEQRMAQEADLSNHLSEQAGLAELATRSQ